MEVGEMCFGISRGKLPVVHYFLDYQRGRPILTSLVRIICSLCFSVPVYVICAHTLCASRHEGKVNAYFARALINVGT
jgi:hypothetical protein